jgi:hypothetical protein
MTLCHPALAGQDTPPCVATFAVKRISMAVSNTAASKLAAGADSEEHRPNLRRIGFARLAPHTAGVRRDSFMGSPQLWQPLL